jgi:hypothetical protein
MTLLPSGTRLTYVINRKNWHLDLLGGFPLPPQITVALVADGTGTVWEFAVFGHDDGTDAKSIKVIVPSSAFAAFTQIPEFFAALATGSNIATLDMATSLLCRIGAEAEA